MVEMSAVKALNAGISLQIEGGSMCRGCNPYLMLQQHLQDILRLVNA